MDIVLVIIFLFFAFFSQKAVDFFVYKKGVHEGVSFFYIVFLGVCFMYIYHPDLGYIKSDNFITLGLFIVGLLYIGYFSHVLSGKRKKRFSQQINS